MKSNSVFLFALLGLSTISPAFAGDGHSHGHGKEETHHNESEHEDEHGHEKEDEHGHEEENASHINDTMAAQVGIETALSSSQVLHETVISYGKLSAGPEQLSHVRARYSGLITEVTASIGDVVKAGDLLAKVESNESLKSYRIQAPISGVIIQRHANTGEVTQDQVLFSIGNFDTLWAEFRIYPHQQGRVQPGQAVHIAVNEQETESLIAHIIPALEKNYLLARAKISNHSRRFSPGLVAEGSIAISEYPVTLAVEKDSVQSLGGRKGVFIKDKNEYAFTPLILGKEDEHFVEVISGMGAGQAYVVKNSYLIKADIEKSEAEHDH